MDACRHRGKEGERPAKEGVGKPDPMAYFLQLSVSDFRLHGSASRGGAGKITLIV